MNFCQYRRLSNCCADNCELDCLPRAFHKGGDGMEYFGIIGMSLGTMGFIFSLNALGQIAKLEKQLKEIGILEKNNKSE